MIISLGHVYLVSGVYVMNAAAAPCWVFAAGHTVRRVLHFPAHVVHVVARASYVR